ncbi:MAG: SDR family oxidoreductase [Deltaproteobacteria bacterium]|nr:SDR family oxidoreductase [Deltaproteobacteria bacterium]MBW1984010.1 SDR family oxidoreductase [Deltaproteobacteria bacterium]MBW2181671.1 SDR family oxidoreductase [Deltaproteobacteria bacterium]MBW2364764.1 SDR family oxidoreductase [Deltaproteobacteria bacterium]
MGIFSGKTAIVTGGASGIGRALAEELARGKANVILADVNSKQLDEVVEAIRKAGNNAKAVTLDVSNYEAVKKLVEDTVADNSKLDYIFNNAGIAVGGEARDCSIDDWRSVLDVNLYGVINGVASAYPIMVEQGSGHIINTASIEGLMPFPGTISYVASKYAVVGLSNTLRLEGADLGVKVSVVCPGYIKTAIFHDSKMIKMDRDKVLERLPERFGITPEKCALAILKGVERNKAFIVVTGFAKFLWLLYRISPGLIHWMMGRGLKESRQEVRIED